MIRPDELQNALYAFQGALVKARTLAYDAQNASLARLLDHSEYLPRLMAEPEDCTESFRSTLSEVAQGFSSQFVLDRFDEPLPTKWQIT